MGIYFSQTDLAAVRNSGVSARQELNVVTCTVHV